MGKKFLVTLATIIGLSVAACTDVSDPQEAVVKKIECTTNNCVTTIQFNDGTIFTRDGSWSDVGDTITACKRSGDWGERWSSCGANTEEE